MSQTPRICVKIKARSSIFPCRTGTPNIAWKVECAVGLLQSVWTAQEHGSRLSQLATQLWPVVRTRNAELVLTGHARATGMLSRMSLLTLFSLLLLFLPSLLLLIVVAAAATTAPVVVV